MQVLSILFYTLQFKLSLLSGGYQTSRNGFRIRRILKAVNENLKSKLEEINKILYQLYYIIQFLNFIN